MRRVRWLTCLLVLCFAPAVLAQADCPTLVKAALDTAAENCKTTGRNQACYGNIRLDVTPQAGVQDFSFEKAGDKAAVNDLQSLKLSSFSDTSGEWGVAILKLQASLPDTAPQDTTLVLFGDVKVENAVSVGVTVNVTPKSAARGRTAPSTSGTPIASLPAGTSLVANGRTEKGDWVRVVLPKSLQRSIPEVWVSVSVLQVDGDVMSLSVVKSDNQPRSPMGAFYFASGVADRPCAEAPNSGILIQTPEGAGMVSFLVNEVEISLGSTLYLQAGNGAMMVNVVEGKSLVKANGTTQFVPAGTYSEIPLSTDGKSPAGAPSDPQPYDYAKVATLPVGVAPQGSAKAAAAQVPVLPKAVPAAAPVPDDQIGAAQSAVFAPYGGMDGVYVLNPIPGSLVIFITPTHSGGACNNPPQTKYILSFTAQGVSTGGTPYPRIGDGVFGDPASAHAAGNFTTPLAAGQEKGAVTLTVLSLTEVYVRTSASYHEASGVMGACSFELQGSWQAPLPPGG